MTALVTGDRGPIGRYVVDALVETGERVLGYADLLTSSAAERPGTALDHVFDLAPLLHGIREHGVERIVHAADASDAGLSIAMPVATVVANVEPALHLLEAARLAQLGGRVVLLSSTAVYGHNPAAIDESSALRPRTAYGVTKVTTEHLGRIYAELYGLDVVVLRLGEVYGPELVPPASLGTLLQSAVRGTAFESAVGADHTFHLTHGEDASRAIAAALSAPAPTQRIYNITGGERSSLAEIAALLSHRFPQSRLEVGPGHLANLDQQGPIDIAAADRELGYRPLWGLARGLDDYAEWLLAYREAA